MAQMSVVPFVPSDFSWRMYVDLNHDLSAVHDDAAARTHWLEHGFGQRRLYALHQLYVEDEFGNEVVLYIPYYCYLRDAGLLFGHRIHTYRGMRDIYIAAGFSPDQIVERHARRHWAPPARRPFVPPQSEHARRFDPEFRRPPPLRAAFADDAEAWTALRAAAGDDGRPLAIVHNKVNIEWGALRAVNAMPTDAVLSAVAQLLTEGFRVLYIRPRAAAAGPVGSIATARGFSEDAGELIECDDFAKLEAAYGVGEVLSMEALLTNLPSDWSYNRVKGVMYAHCSHFVHCQGGASYFAAYFGGHQIVYHIRGDELVAGAYPDWFQTLYPGGMASLVVVQSPAALDAALRGEAWRHAKEAPSADANAFSAITSA